MKKAAIGLLVIALAGFARVTAIQRVTQAEVKSILDKKVVADAAYAAFEKARVAVCDQETAVMKAHSVPNPSCGYYRPTDSVYTFSSGLVTGGPYWHFTEDYLYLLKE